MMYFGYFLVGVAVLLAIAGLVQRNKAKKILAAPFHKTGEIATNPSVADARGMVSTEGAVASAQPLTSPQTSTPCVYFEYKLEKEIEEWKSTDKGMQKSKRWVDVESRTQGTVFQLDDGSGPISIDATQGSLDCDLRQTFSGPPEGGGAAASMAKLLTGGTRYRVTEKIVPASGNLFAMGRLSAGAITKAEGMLGKLMLSTKGRDGLVAHTRKVMTICWAIGGLLFVTGVPLGIFGDKPEGSRAKSEVGAVDEPATESSTKLSLACSDSLDGLGSKAKDAFSATCPRGCTQGSIYGTGVYTTDSPICVAAVHAGAITSKEGGDVSVVVGAGLSAYEGSTRNGITSNAWGPFGKSYRVSSPSGPVGSK